MVGFAVKGGREELAKDASGQASSALEQAARGAIGAISPLVAAGVERVLDAMPKPGGRDTMSSIGFVGNGPVQTQSKVDPFIDIHHKGRSDLIRDTNPNRDGAISRATHSMTEPSAIDQILQHGGQYDSRLIASLEKTKEQLGAIVMLTKGPAGEKAAEAYESLERVLTRMERGQKFTDPASGPQGRAMTYSDQNFQLLIDTKAKVEAAELVFMTNQVYGRGGAGSSRPVGLGSAGPGGAGSAQPAPENSRQQFEGIGPFGNTNHK